jgi:hypothetical protein
MFLYKAQLLFDRELHKKVSEAIQQEREKWKEETKKEVLEALEENNSIKSEELRSEFCKKHGYSYLHILEGAYKEYIEFLEAKLTEVKPKYE